MTDALPLNDRVAHLATKMPRQAVVVIIERRDGRVLFIRRPDADSYPGYWNNVTGACEECDLGDLAATCVREAQEEVGLRVEVVGKLWESTTSRASFVLHWFLARVADESGEPRIVPDPEEVSGVQWIAPSDVARLPLAFADTRMFFARQYAELRTRVLSAL